MKKEITVTINENSHKHAEMMIHAMANPYLCIFVKDCNGGKWSEQRTQVLVSSREYFLCHPNHEKECLHFLNWGTCIVSEKCGGSSERSRDREILWTQFSIFMNPEANIRIKQEPEYVKAEFALASQACEAWENGSLYIVHDDEYKELKRAIDVLEFKDRLYRKVEKEK